MTQRHNKHNGIVTNYLGEGVRLTIAANPIDTCGSLILSILQVIIKFIIIKLLKEKY